MHAEKRKANTGSDNSRIGKVTKTSADAKPWGSPNRKSDTKTASPTPSTSHDTSRDSHKYGNVASVKRRLISPKKGHEGEGLAGKKSVLSPPRNSMMPIRSGLQRTPPHLRKYSLRSPRKTSPSKTSSVTTPIKSPMRGAVGSPNRTFSPRHSVSMLRKTPRKSTENSPYKLRSPHQKGTTPGKSKCSREDELNLSSDAGLEHLKLLSEQLSSLNQDSGALTTAMYKSDRKKQTPDKTKSAPGKVRPSAKNKTPRKKILGNVPGSSNKSTLSDGAACNVVNGDSDSWDTDDSAELNIVEPDLDLDAVLDSHADKNKLTVLNVKNILHHVITNEHVVAMVRSKLLKEDPEDRSFEPKMTRSKVKEILETGQLPHPWPISPIKKQEKEKPATIMELSFSDEEDEEYDPQKEPVSQCDSDDSESFISSTQNSEYGSPGPATPSTPKPWPLLTKEDVTPKAKISTPVQLLLSPDQGLMGPPLPPRHGLSNLRSRLNEVSSIDEEEETIATRTRSKLPLTDTPLDEIESNFVAPDITPDLYDTQCDDKEWGRFLSGLMKTGETDLNDTQDDEQNDPEYNFLAEEENNVDDADEMRDDRAVKVSKKELNELLDELFEAYGGADILEDDEVDNTLKPTYNTPPPMKLDQSQKAVVMVEVEQEERKNDILEKIPDEIPVISAAERQQLEDQMRKHVQLLLQVGVLAGDTPWLETSANTCRFLLNELQRFANHSPAGTQSVFNTFNLESANEAIQSYRGQTPEKSENVVGSPKSDGKKVNPRRSSSPEQLGVCQKRFFALCDACIYPRLLPVAKFHPPLLNINEKIQFTEAEDNLLALAVAEFQHMPSYVRLIQYYVMPAKTEDQLKIHIKNKFAKRSSDNLIKQARMKKILPKFPSVIDPFDPNDPKLPIDHPKESMPGWLQKLKKLEEWKNLRKERQNARKKKKRLEKRNAVKANNMELNENVQDHLKKNRKELPLSPGVRTRCMRKKDSIKSTVMSKITTRGARKKLSETFGTSYDDIDLTQEVTSASQASTLECDENADDLESIHNDSGNQSAVSTCSSATSSDSDSDSNQSPNLPSASKNSNQSANLPNTSKSNSSAPVDETRKRDLPPRKILPANGNPLLNLPLITVCVTPPGPQLASEAETSTAQNVVPNPIPQAVQPVQGYMQAADADPPVAPVLQAVMPAAEAAQPKVPIIVVDNRSEERHQNIQVPASASNSSQGGSNDGSNLRGSPPGSNMASPAQSVAADSPASRSMKDEEAPANLSQTPPAKIPPSVSSPATISNLTVGLKIGACTPSKPGFVTPNKKYPLLVPKPTTCEKTNAVSPFIEDPSLKYRGHPSPRIKRRLLTRPIKPKGIIVNAFISPTKSPTKKAADSIKARLRKKNRPILPKLHDVPRVLESGSRALPPPAPRDGVSDEEYGSDGEGDNRGMSSPIADEASYFLDSGNEETAGDCQGEEEAEDSHLAELMAASTTISTKRQKRNPLVEKKALTDAVFASSIVESDPLREDRDTAFARAYLTRVKQSMKNDLESFEKFVKILAEFGEDSQKTSVQLYPEVCELLKPYPDLLLDFASFLSPGEALECGCLSDTDDFHRARAFLRKLEVHFQKHPNFFQKIVKALDTCRNGATDKLQDLQQLMKSLLRGHPHLLEEFMAFFPHEKPPISQMTDFEEVTLEYSDEEPTPYETVKLPYKETAYGTSRCSCSCHGASDVMRRKTHCRKCALTIIDGQLCLMTKNRGQGGASVVVFTKQTDPEQELDEDSQQSGPSRRASLDSSGQGLSDIENMEEGVPEPHRRKRAHGSHKVLAELTDSSDQASNETMEPGYYGLDNLPRNNTSGSLDEEEDDDDVDDDDLEDDDDDEDDDEDVLADDEDETNEDKDDINDDDDDDVGDDLDNIDDSDDNDNIDDDDDDDDEDDDFDPSAYIEEEENEENQSSEIAESPDNSKSESTLVDDGNCNVTDEQGSISKDGAKGNPESNDIGSPENSSMNVVNMNSKHNVSSTDEASEVTDGSSASEVTKKTGCVTERSAPIMRSNSAADEDTVKSHTLEDQKDNNTWTRDEDTLILETCKNKGPTIRSFRIVAHKLKHRTAEQVSDRFNQLLNQKATGGFI